MANLKDRGPSLARLLVMVGILGMWCSTPTLAQEASQYENLTRVDYDRITVSLPIYILSLGATATGAWAVSRYERRRDKQMDALKAEMESLRAEVERYGCKGVDHNHKR